MVMNMVWKNKKKEVFAWSMYDFANQPSTTLIVTFIFSAFFTEFLAEDNQKGTYLWSMGISVTAIFVAFFSPILGALADSGGYRKLFLVFFSYLCIIATFCLYFFEPGQLFNFDIYFNNFNVIQISLDVTILSLIVFVIANIGFEFGTVFCNSYLSDVSEKENIGTWARRMRWDKRRDGCKRAKSAASSSS